MKPVALFRWIVLLALQFLSQTYRSSQRYQYGSHYAFHPFHVSVNDVKYYSSGSLKHLSLSHRWMSSDDRENGMPDNYSSLLSLLNLIQEISSSKNEKFRQSIEKLKESFIVKFIQRYEVSKERLSKAINIQSRLEDIPMMHYARSKLVKSHIESELDVIRKKPSVIAYYNEPLEMLEIMKYPFIFPVETIISEYPLRVIDILERMKFELSEDIYEVFDDQKMMILKNNITSNNTINPVKDRTSRLEELKERGKMLYILGVLTRLKLPTKQEKEYQDETKFRLTFQSALRFEALRWRLGRYSKDILRYILRDSEVMLYEDNSLRQNNIPKGLINVNKSSNKQRLERPESLSWGSSQLGRINSSLIDPEVYQYTLLDYKYENYSVDNLSRRVIPSDEELKTFKSKWRSSMSLLESCPAMFIQMKKNSNISKRIVLDDRIHHQYIHEKINYPLLLHSAMILSQATYNLRLSNIIDQLSPIYTQKFLSIINRLNGNRPVNDEEAFYSLMNYTIDNAQFLMVRAMKNLTMSLLNNTMRGDGSLSVSNMVQELSDVVNQKLVNAMTILSNEMTIKAKNDDNRDRNQRIDREAEESAVRDESSEVYGGVRKISMGIRDCTDSDGNRARERDKADRMNELLSEDMEQLESSASKASRPTNGSKYMGEDTHENVIVDWNEGNALLSLDPKAIDPRDSSHSDIPFVSSDGHKVYNNTKINEDLRRSVAMARHALGCPTYTNDEILLVRTIQSDKACAIITYDKRFKLVTLAFRGTKDSIDIITDITFLPRPFVPPVVLRNDAAEGSSHDKYEGMEQDSTDGKEVDEMKVHSGFLAAFDSLVLELNAVLSSFHPQFGITSTLQSNWSHHELPMLYIVGHSMGGALAQLAAAYYAVCKPYLVTIAAPAVGNKQFCDYVCKYVYPSGGGIRVWNEYDIVPYLAMIVGYDHVGIPLKMRASTPAKDLFKRETNLMNPLLRDYPSILDGILPHILYQIGSIVYIYPVLGVDISR